MVCHTLFKHPFHYFPTRLTFCAQIHFMDKGNALKIPTDKHLVPMSSWGWDGHVSQYFFQIFRTSSKSEGEVKLCQNSSRAYYDWVWPYIHLPIIHQLYSGKHCNDGVLLQNSHLPSDLLFESSMFVDQFLCLFQIIGKLIRRSSRLGLDQPG